MKQNIIKAIKLYYGDKPVALFVEKLDQNAHAMNFVFNKISQLFSTAKIENFEKLPAKHPERRRFAKLFKELNMYLVALLFD